MLLQKPSILRRLLFAIAGTGVAVALISGFAHYTFTSRLIEVSVRNQMQTALQSSLAYLERTYTAPLTNDLKLLESSIAANTVLMSPNADVYIHRPNAEHLFLSVLNANENLYTSIRLVDASGREKIIVSERKRSRDYTSLLEVDKNDKLRSELGQLFARLNQVDPGTIIFSGPIKHLGNSSFLAGIAKQDPEIGGFGGAVIASFLLADYMKYLARFKVFDQDMVWLFDKQGEVLLRPGNDQMSLNPAAHLFKQMPVPTDALIFSSTERTDSDMRGVIRIAFSMSPKVLAKQLGGAELITFYILIPIVVIAFIIAFFMAKKLISPINALTVFIRRIGEGDLSARTDIKSRDEIGDLAITFNQMADDLHAQRDQLENLAHNDPLTQLPNRVSFDRQLKYALEVCQTSGKRLAMLYLDMDQFKDTNEILGHPTGDKLIRNVSERIRDTIRSYDIVARLGRDEFAVVLQGYEERSQVEIVGQKLLKALVQPFIVGDIEVFSSVSIGISLFPEHGTDVTTLVKNADAAMYKAKKAGRNNFQFYDEELTLAAKGRIMLGAKIRQAIQQDDFMLYYQPKLSLKTGQIIGAEALLRWQTESGMVPPNKIVEVAESSGFIDKIDTWVLNKACHQIRDWLDEGVGGVKVAINLSGFVLERSRLLTMVETVLGLTGIDPKWLEIEVTEGYLMQHHDQAASTFSQLREMGVTFSIDDFGTGYSSLAYLKGLPIDALKIDRSFIMDIMEDSNDKAIATAIIALAHALNMTVIAEGVETEEQANLLRDLNCDAVQGYYYSGPVNVEEFVSYMHEHKVAS